MRISSSKEIFWLGCWTCHSRGTKASDAKGANNCGHVHCSCVSVLSDISLLIKQTDAAASRVREILQNNEDESVIGVRVGVKTRSFELVQNFDLLGSCQCHLHPHYFSSTDINYVRKDEIKRARVWGRTDWVGG